MAAKNFIQIIALFVIGMAGGIFADKILWPYFVERPLFHQYQLEQSPTYITQNQNLTMYVQENTAIRESVQDVLPAIAGVKTKTASGEILEGSGLVLTSDGLIVTLATLVPRGSEFSFFVDDEWVSFQILRRDIENNLALVKVEKNGLKSRGFMDMAKIKLAEPVFLVGTDFPAVATTSPQNIVNVGILTALDEELLKTNIFENQQVAGSPLFDIEGRVVGLSALGQDGRVWAIPADTIRTFAGF